jgi:hypothetical protein
MFEIIGLIVAIIILLFLSALVGALYALVAWLLLRGEKGPRKRWITLAATLPPASAAYLVVCAIGFTFIVRDANDRLFGDFNERLPNGYTLTGLAKMPDFAFIDSKIAGVSQPPLLGGIARLDVDGPLIFGEYSHKTGSFDDPVAADSRCFIFDTHTRQLWNLGKLPTTDIYSGRPLHLVEPQYFHSHEPAEILRRHIENVVYLGPPILATLLYFVFLFRIRQRTKCPSTVET